MLVRAAEESFKKGMRALDDQRWLEAMVFFEAALQSARRQNGTRKLEARYLSYYGLCLGLNGKRNRDAISLCRQAVKQEEFNPELQWNLGRVLLVAGRRREAHRAFTTGLRQAPDHLGLQRDLARMGRRRRPVLPFLSRSNPINVMLGRWRAGRRGSRRSR